MQPDDLEVTAEETEREERREDCIEVDASRSYVCIYEFILIR